MKIILPWPPSLNHHLKNDGRGGRLPTKITRAFRDECFVALHRQKLRYAKIAGKIKTVEKYYPPDRRQRDLGNFHKEIWDALEREHVIYNDEQIKDHHEVMMHPDPKHPRVEIDLYVTSWEPLDVIREKVLKAWKKSC